MKTDLLLQELLGYEEAGETRFSDPGTVELDLAEINIVVSSPWFAVLPRGKPAATESRCVLGVLVFP